MEKNGNAIRLRNEIAIKNKQKIRKKQLDTKYTNYSTFGGSSNIPKWEVLKNKKN